MSRKRERNWNKKKNPKSDATEAKYTAEEMKVIKKNGWKRPIGQGK